MDRLFGSFRRLLPGHGKEARCAALFTVLIAAAGCPGQQTTSAPTTQPTTAATAPTQPTSQPVDKLASSVLKELEQAGQEYETVQAEIVYETENPTLGDREQRTGWVAFRASSDQTPAMFRVHFETLRQGAGPARRARMDYAFDGAWLTQKNYRTRQLTRYQVAAEGEKIEPLRLGKGPFPMPFGQKRQDVLEHFAATARPAHPDKQEPAGTVYLELTTKHHYREELGLAGLRMWVDQDRDLPVRVVSEDLNRNVTTVTFTNIRTNEPPQEDTFSLPRPPGWTVSLRPLDKSANP